MECLQPLDLASSKDIVVRWQSARPKVVFYNRRRILSLFLLIDLLIYLDRGIVPGAHDEFQRFLAQSPTVQHHPEFFFGLVQSIFIAGLALTAPILSWLAAKSQRPLFYLSRGLTFWVTSLCLCGIAGLLNSVPLFFLGRALSGVGEGAFLALMIPILMDAFSLDDRGFFLGVFYGLMPIGTAFGFISSASSTRHLPCWAPFLLLSVLAAIPTWVVCRFASTPASFGTSPLRHLAEVPSADAQSTTPSQDGLTVEEETPPLKLRTVLTSPSFLSLVLSGAAQAALCSVLISFGTAFLLNLELFQTELKASLVVGGLGSAIGAVGTLLGGLLLFIPQRWIQDGTSIHDYLHEDAHLDETFAEHAKRASTLKCVTSFVLVMAIPASVLLSITPSLLYLEKSVASCVVFALGLLLLFMCQSGLNLSVMLCAPSAYRSLSISTFTLGLHLFGDVPSPVLIGYLKDWLAPDCATQLSGVSSLCRSERTELLLTLALALLWSHFVWIGVGLCNRYINKK